ncbi:uncharacterized protein LOC142233799 [Haematobia irritans]|uniref:uncharacterized protein LOC142233799 n=1 Tax=Haematobia irritans TaxID=7368 RepID=UPI003F504BF1
MKFLAVLGLVGICAIGSLAMVPPPASAPTTGANGGIVVIPTPPPAPTMAQDLDEIMRMINFLQINQLMRRYLLNDAEFQSFVRIINSQDAFLTYMHFRSQPEVMAFVSWVNAQILASGGEFKLEEGEEMMSIFNTSPFWANTVFGWQGFISEFMLYYPSNMISAHVNMKLTQNGIFAQLWQRLVALKPVYERVIAAPQAQRVAAALQLHGIDVAQLDTFIRSQFGWQVPPTLAPTSTTTAAPAVSSTTVTPSTTSGTIVEPSAAVPVAPVA